MCNQNQTNYYRPSFFSGSHSKEGISKQWATRIHLLRYGKSIRFNMETRHLMDKHEAGIEGKIFKSIQNFLKSKSCKFKVNKILSDTKVQAEDIPQGSVVSPPFSILKINKMVQKLPMITYFRYHFTMMFSRYPTAIQNGRFFRESSRTV